MAMRPNDGDGMRDFAVKKFKCALALQSYAEVRTPSKKTPLAHTSNKTSAHGLHREREAI